MGERFVNQSELKQLMAEFDTQPIDVEAVQAGLAAAALSHGVYDASVDQYPTTEHPEDDRWIIPSNN